MIDGFTFRKDKAKHVNADNPSTSPTANFQRSELDFYSLTKGLGLSTKSFSMVLNLFMSIIHSLKITKDI